MKLSLEIPKKHLEEFSRVTDADFALAHEVLGDKVYAEFYAEQRKKGRFVILDNGMYEMGKPLSCDEILSAAERIDPSIVTPPDKMQDARFTYDSFETMRHHPRRRWDLLLVLQGSTSDERIKLFMHGRPYAKGLAMPFREPRSQWFMELVRAVPKYLTWPSHLHLFGVNELDELKWWADTIWMPDIQWHPSRVSVDTGKPFKWAQADKYMWEVEQLRNGVKLDHEKQLSATQSTRAFANIAYLRRWMG